MTVKTGHSRLHMERKPGGEKRAAGFDGLGGKRMQKSKKGGWQEAEPQLGAVRACCLMGLDGGCNRGARGVVWGGLGGGWEHARERKQARICVRNRLYRLL